MRVHGLDQLEVELAHELQVAIDPLQDWIDDQCLAARPAGEQVGVGSRNLIKELTEDHGAIPFDIQHTKLREFHRSGSPDFFAVRESANEHCRWGPLVTARGPPVRAWLL